MTTTAPITTLHRQLLTSKQKILNISTSNVDIINHFYNLSNHADDVLNTFNHDRFYDAFFKGWENLTVLDIGGNIGLFALYIQDRAKEVYSLEPTPSHYNKLCEMTKQFSNIHPINVALHNKDEDIEFFISDENTTMNSTVNHYGKKTIVKGKTLLTLINELNLSKVDFVKCDIEGSEMSALTNETIGSVKDIVNVWSIEVHQTNHNVSWSESVEYNRDKLIEIFKNQGYNVYKHRPDCLYAHKV